ncbi:hypothetical protein PPL_08255 [Heterostelium album PN500]|uniref:SAC3/GANP/THP3 conserved domain-containing protein n=1 Tax=Heterostelium pallidum (strain ATCC 26659 / Pp 5 / PN500) TaxID=670386 RepID=D3BJ18_HETP5|nr:hypothetical protein PPL_08255 [Heterostelium album PN500]EFA78792.1 hypothetical protein PPL_08255 [Heterostelium album PN500]|eukprot:XP_020430916.1 hypothetical protein PPL_08255 [Heterostelium album PN500]
MMLYSGNDLNDTQNNINKRNQRFGIYSATSAASLSTSTGNQHHQTYTDSGELDWDSMTIKGTSTDLEKPYLRLTSAPDPSTVRPEPTLRKTFDHLKRHWKDKQDYTYICEQFRSMRQDMRVQNIKNQFSIDVYEAHARLAMENGDLGQFNQCQTQLFELYKIPGNKGKVAEFFAYRILYCIFQNNSTDMTKTFSELTQDLAAQECVKYALKIRAAFYDNNFIRYFKLCQSTFNMENYILDKISPRIRITALQVMTKAVRPTILLEQITPLGFANDKEAREYLEKHSFKFTDKNKTEFDTKLNHPIAMKMEQPVINVITNDKF